MKAMSNDEPSYLHDCVASIIGEENAVSWENIPLNQQQSILQAIAPGTSPSCIVYPQTIEQLGAVIAEAHRNKWRVLPCGSGSKLSWGGLAKGIDIVVSTKRLNRLIEHAVGDLTITVETGMKFSHLQAILADAGQFLAIDPSVPDSATIGGIVATGDTGSLRQRYGSVRDQLLGITFVRADGKIAKAGGRVVKNVAGYDLMKLFTGSYGTLGVICQVTFRVYPLPQLSGTVVLRGAAEVVSQAADILRGSALTPTRADLLSTQLVADLGLGSGLGLIVRFESIVESVREQSNRMKEVGEQLGLDGVVFSAADEADLWRRLQEQMDSAGNELAISCKIGVLPTAAVGVLKGLDVGLIHVSSGVGVVRLDNLEQVLQLRGFLGSWGGFLSVREACVGVKQDVDVWGYTGNALPLMRGIKALFDGEGILCPGRFVGGI